MRFSCCCCQVSDEEEPLLSEDKKKYDKPLEDPVRSCTPHGQETLPYGYSDFDNQSVKGMKGDRAPDENVVPDVETKPNRRKKRPEAGSSASGTNSVEQAANFGEKGTKPKKKKVETNDELSKVLDFKRFDISELDCIFADFKTTLDPFVQNREDMAKAEESFKKAVTTLEQVSPHAQFSEYVHALKTRLTSEGIVVKIKEGALAIYTEGKKAVQGILDAVAAVNAILKLSKELKAMPMIIARGSDDAVERAEGMDLQGILKREFKSVWDLGKIPRLKKAFSNNVQQVRRAPDMVRDFYSQAKKIILEIYHAFADEEEQKKIEGELNEGDDTSKEKDKSESNEAEEANGGSTSKKKTDKKEGSKADKSKSNKEKDKEEFHKKLKFDSVGLDDIDNMFSSLATVINPFVETRESLQAAKESFENIVKKILNFEANKELKEYITELKKDAKEGNITIYIDETDGEIKVKSIEGVKPPKPYRDAVEALKNIRTAGSEAVELEPDVQHGIEEFMHRITQIKPQRDFHSLLKKKSDVRALPRKIKRFNENRKKAQEIPGIVKEFCLYVERILTDILEALTGEEDSTTKKEEGSGEEGDKSPTDENQPKKYESHHKPLEGPVRSCTPHGQETLPTGYSDFDNQRVKGMKGNRAPEKNVVPDDETKPNRRKKRPEAGSSASGTNSVEQAANFGEKGTKPKKKKEETNDELSKVLDFKRFDISELDCIFADFKTTLDPFVQNRQDMAKAEESFKKAVTTLEQVSPHAQFSEYVHALKTRLTSEGIVVKIKEGALAIYTEGKKTVQEILDAVAAVNAILKLSKELKAMPMIIARGSDDAVERAEGMDLPGILKREFKSVWDLGKIPRLIKAFSNNVQQVRRAPDMVRDFYSQAKKIILEIYHAFADEEEQKKIEGELNEGDDTSKGKDKSESNEADEANGGSTSKKKTDKKEVSKADKSKSNKEKDKEEFHKKLKFDSVGLDDIDNMFSSLATVINPFVETRESLQAAKESFENIVKKILNFEANKELKEYIKELKKDAKEGNITIYIDETDDEIKVKSIEGVKPPKPYRDAVEALKNIRTAGSEAVELEPDVQHGIEEFMHRITQINPQRDFHSLLKKKSDVFALPGKIKRFNENRKKAQEIPGIVKEFCLYVERILTDILEALTGEEDTATKKEEGSGEGGDGQK
ncbi:myosin-2 heavy chain-like [Pocillopora verrucosa]|uniref:myosin-2 heavy chain-like n=1 Tax=Pocillopora verrucosa TaxID=203993 RepID=UPI00333E2C36